VAVDPSHFNVRSFVRLLSEKRTLEAYTEAVDTARSVYDRANPENDKWPFAVLTLSVYRSANAQDPGTFDPNLVDEFVARVREDSNEGLITRALADPARDPAAMRYALEAACRLAAIYGQEFCMRGIEATVQAAIRYPDIPDAQILADAAAIGVMAAPRITGVVELGGGVSQVGADIGTPRLTAWLDQLVDSRLDSLVVLDSLASTVHDMNRRFEVRREIVERTPNSGRARFDLAQQYFNRKEWEQALPHLELARELVPPDDEFQDLVREYVFTAEYEIRNRN
jgi:tetratricopeptide (TPR) repeat protein